ncbi:Ig-like domain-containing protein [Rhodococcus sp. NPDC127528]|uniref:Ig-like domain-containing protein n=1 Tax=unclassified Rhodococcus (in: high G+C Gram-positive bacteria) TaxID=192944 RepID=UPI003643BFA3
MARPAITRGVTAATTALAAGAVVLLGGAAANAAPATIEWNDGGTNLTRTVSNTNPNPGDVITVSTRWARNNAHYEELWWAKDFHPTCLTYVPGSAKLTDKAGVHTVEPYVETKPDYTAADFATSGYKPLSKNFDDTPTLSFQYTVGADCARGTALYTGVSYNGSRGQGDYVNKGPAVTVAADSVSASLAPVSGAVVGTATTLTVTVTPHGAGNVEFKDGDTVIGTAAVGADGTATQSWTPATAGDRTITATYNGPGGTATTSAVVTVTAASGDGSSTGSLGSLFGS